MEKKKLNLLPKQTKQQALIKSLDNLKWDAEKAILKANVAIGILKGVMYDIDGLVRKLEEEEK